MKQLSILFTASPEELYLTGQELGIPLDKLETFVHSLEIVKVDAEVDSNGDVNFTNISKPTEEELKEINES